MKMTEEELQWETERLLSPDLFAQYTDTQAKKKWLEQYENNYAILNNPDLTFKEKEKAVYRIKDLSLQNEYVIMIKEVEAITPTMPNKYYSTSQEKITEMPAASKKARVKATVIAIFLALLADFGFQAAVLIFKNIVGIGSPILEAAAGTVVLFGTYKAVKKHFLNKYIKKEMSEENADNEMLSNSEYTELREEIAKFNLDINQKEESETNMSYFDKDDKEQTRLVKAAPAPAPVPVSGDELSDDEIIKQSKQTIKNIRRKKLKEKFSRNVIPVIVLSVVCAALLCTSVIFGVKYKETKDELYLYKTTVYYVASGKGKKTVYHTNVLCSNINSTDDIETISLYVAQKRDYTLCSVCKKRDEEKSTKD